MDDGGWGSIRVLEFSAWVLTATAKLQNQDKTHAFEKKIAKNFACGELIPINYRSSQQWCSCGWQPDSEKNSFFLLEFNL